MADVPETPEGVALALLMLILSAANPALASPYSPVRQILDIYGECLQVARGTEYLSRDLLH